MSDQYTQQDPTTQYPQPNFGEQNLQHPGLDQEMDPKPDYGYETYRGSGRLEGKKAIIAGSDSGLGGGSPVVPRPRPHRRRCVGVWGVKSPRSGHPSPSR